MVKKYIKISIFAIILIIFSVSYYHRIYLSESRIDKDIQGRLKNNSYNIIMGTYERLQQKTVDNKIVILYRFKSNEDFVGCSIYQRDIFGKYKFDKNEFGLSNTENTMISTKDIDGKSSHYLIHFGYVRDNYPSKYKVSLKDKTFIQEYEQDSYFLEYYDISNNLVEITPIY